MTAAPVPADVAAAIDARVDELIAEHGPMPDSVAVRLVEIIDSKAVSSPDGRTGTRRSA